MEPNIMPQWTVSNENYLLDQTNWLNHKLPYENYLLDQTNWLNHKLPY